MQNIVFTIADTDKEKIEKLVLLLPEKEFLDFLKFLEMSTSYSHIYNGKLATAISLSKGTFANFENDTINEKYRQFNMWLSELYSFLLKYFFLSNIDASRYDLHYELKHGTDEQIKQWKSEYERLRFIIEQTEFFYKDLLTTAQKETERKQVEVKSKILLSDYAVSFESETGKLKVGDFYSVDFPPFKNEYYILRKLYSTLKDELIDWEEVYEEMQGLKSSDTEKNKKTVKDAVRAVNTRIQKTLNTDSQLIVWETNCLKRIY